MFCFGMSMYELASGAIIPDTQLYSIKTGGVGAIREKVSPALYECIQVNTRTKDINHVVFSV